MVKSRTPWFAVQCELPARRRTVLGVGAFVLPLVAWCIFSYVPFVWHPLVRVTDAGGMTLEPNKRYQPDYFNQQNADAVAAGKAAAQGKPANPVFLPAPHEVAVALFTSFTDAPRRPDEPWLHQHLWHSVQVIFWGFAYSCMIGVPIGVLCGTYGFVSRLTEPFVDFIRYMPAPVFGALMVAILGTADAPKVAIIFIGTFFQMVLVISNTTRRLDRSLLEAAQTLGADNRRLLTRVIVPGILPHLFRDLRILLGWAWTYLIIAELIGEKSGISAYIQQQGRYFNFDRVFAGIIIIGCVGLVTDQCLRLLEPILFPWQGERVGPVSRALRGTLWRGPRHVFGRVLRQRDGHALRDGGDDAESLATGKAGDPRPEERTDVTVT